MGRPSLPGVVGLALAQLRHERAQTILAVVGVALAVLSATLLVSVGYGVIATGEEKFDQAGRDIWVSGGAVQIQPGTLGGLEGSLHDAHTVSRDIDEMDGVQSAVPMLFQTVYASAEGEDPKTTLAVGVPGVGGGSVALESGSGFSQSGRVHYADGAYDGPRSEEVVIDPRLAEQYGVEVGETMHVGATVGGARNAAYTVQGTSRTFSQFLGTPVVVLPLSELQTMTGAARSDTATMLTVSATDDADVDALADRIQEDYPQYDVRTNSEQLQAVLAKQALIIASGGVLVVLGLVAGVALTVNILSLLVYQQRTPLAAIRALGVSRGSLLGMVTTQGLVIGVLGGLLGLGLTPVLGRVLSWVAYRIVGFQGLVQTPQMVYLLGAVIAVGTGTLGAVVAGWRVLQMDVLTALRE